jgi:mannose-6-phosphate isomerase-like protein (cupin superfamily)
MADVTFKRFDELDSHEGLFLYARKGLGVTAWGMNVLRLPAGWDGYPEHDHAGDGQEEAYIVLEGSAELSAGGETWSLEPGTLARVGAEQKRKVVPGPQGVTMVVIGGTPGKAYEPK